MSKEKDVALKIIEKQDEITNTFLILKDDIWESLLYVLAESRGVLNEIPDEKTFLAIIAELLDIAFKFPFPLETLDKPAFYLVLKIVDKNILDKVFGADWFDKLKAKVV